MKNTEVNKRVACSLTRMAIKPMPRLQSNGTPFFHISLNVLDATWCTVDIQWIARFRPYCLALDIRGFPRLWRRKHKGKVISVHFLQGCAMMWLHHKHLHRDWSSYCLVLCYCCHYYHQYYHYYCYWYSYNNKRIHSSNYNDPHHFHYQHLHHITIIITITVLIISIISSLNVGIKRTHKQK